MLDYHLLPIFRPSQAKDQIFFFCRIRLDSFSRFFESRNLDHLQPILRDILTQVRRPLLPPPTIPGIIFYLRIVFLGRSIKTIFFVSNQCLQDDRIQVLLHVVIYFNCIRHFCQCLLAFSLFYSHFRLVILQCFFSYYLNNSISGLYYNYFQGQGKHNVCKTRL